jgi:hypothetical protein
VRLTHLDEKQSTSSASSSSAPSKDKEKEVGAPAPQPKRPAKDAAHMSNADRAVSGSGGKLFYCPISDLPANGRYPYVGCEL